MLAARRSSPASSFSQGPSVTGASEHLLSLVAVAAALTALGQLLVAAFHKRTLLMAYNLCLPLLAAAVVLAGAMAADSRTLIAGTGVATFVLAAMTFSAVRRRVHALNAGGELREHELFPAVGVAAGPHPEQGRTALHWPPG